MDRGQHGVVAGRSCLNVTNYHSYHQLSLIHSGKLWMTFLRPVTAKTQVFCLHQSFEIKSFSEFGVGLRCFLRSTERSQYTVLSEAWWSGDSVEQKGHKCSRSGSVNANTWTLTAGAAIRFNRPLFRHFRNTNPRSQPSWGVFARSRRASLMSRRPEIQCGGACFGCS